MPVTDEEEGRGILDLANAFSAYEDTGSPSAQAALQGLREQYGGVDPTTSEGSQSLQRGISALYAPDDPGAEQPGFWQRFGQELSDSNLIGAGINAGVGGLLHMAGAGKVGDAFMLGSIKNSEDFFTQKAAEQKAALENRQTAWKDAFEMAKQLPEEFLMANPELAEAAMAFQKDAKDGQIDNEKTLSNFLTKFALHKNKLTEFESQQDTARKRADAEEAHQMEQQLAQQDAEKAAQILANPDATEGERQWAASVQANAPVWSEDEGRWMSPQEALQREEMAMRQQDAAERRKMDARQLGISEQRLEMEEERLKLAQQYGGTAAAVGVLGDMVGQSLRESTNHVEAAYSEETDPATRQAMVEDAKADVFNLHSNSILETAESLGVLQRLPDGTVSFGNQQFDLMSDVEARQAEEYSARILDRVSQLREQHPIVDPTLTPEQAAKTYSRDGNAFRVYQEIKEMEAQVEGIAESLRDRGRKLQAIFQSIQGAGAQAEVGMRLNR